MLDLKLTEIGPMPQFPSKGQITLEDKRDLAQSVNWQDFCSGPSHQLHPILFFGRSALLESCSGCFLPQCMQRTCYSEGKENRSRWSLFILALLGTLSQPVHPNTMQSNVLFQWQGGKHCLVWGGTWAPSRSGWMVGSALKCKKVQVLNTRVRDLLHSHKAKV